LNNTDICVADCGIGFYASPIRVCAECDFRCLSCNGGDNTKCTDCDFSKEGIVRGGTTTCNCGNGYFANLEEKACGSIFFEC